MKLFNEVVTQKHRKYLYFHQVFCVKFLLLYFLVKLEQLLILLQTLSNNYSSHNAFLCLCLLH